MLNLILTLLSGVVNMVPGVGLLVLGFALRGIDGQESIGTALAAIGGLFVLIGITSTISRMRELSVDSEYDKLKLFVGFDDAALATNRAGKLTSGQRIRAGGGAVLTGFVLLLFGVGMAVIAVIVLTQQGQNADDNPMLPLLFAGVAFAVLWLGVKRLRDHFRGVDEGVQQLTGVLHVTKRTIGSGAGTGGENPSRQRYRLFVRPSTQHPITRDTLRFAIDRRMFALLRNQQNPTRYTVYYLPQSNIILSLEPTNEGKP